MTADDLESRLRRSATGARLRAPGCPDEHLVAGYVEGCLGDSDHARIEGHLADCAACASLVGELSRQRLGAETGVVPELTLARARRLGEGRSDRWRSFMPQLAAAAVAVVCISALIHFMRADSPLVAREEAAEPRTTRSVVANGATLQVLSPAAGATLDAASLDVRWTGVPAASFYDVRIVTDTGEIVSEQRVSTTGWQPGQGVRLEPGADYYVRVDAFVAGARPVSSEHVPFRVAERD